MSNSDFLRTLGVEFPIIQAPMAGGITTARLVTAVCNAGGLGSLGAAYLTPDQIRNEARQIRALTDKPFNINLFAGGYKMAAGLDAEPMLALLSKIHEALKIPAPVVPDLPPDSFPEQFEAVLEIKPTIFSFTFGIPSSDAMEMLKARGIPAVGTATTVEEACLLESCGVTAIVAQGAEAGGHRGTFLGTFEAAMMPTLDLVHDIRCAVSVPVIASGGIMDGRDIAHAVACGAAAVQLGTAFLSCTECGASEVYRQALLAARSDTTTITRAFSGRPARGLRNAFIDLLDGKDNYTLPYPMQNALTRPMRSAAMQKGQPGYLSLWAGQGVARTRALPAAELVRHLVKETREAGAMF